MLERKLRVVQFKVANGLHNILQHLAERWALSRNRFLRGLGDGVWTSARKCQVPHSLQSLSKRTVGVSRQESTSRARTACRHLHQGAKDLGLASIEGAPNRCEAGREKTSPLGSM